MQFFYVESFKCSIGGAREKAFSFFFLGGVGRPLVRCKLLAVLSNRRKSTQLDITQTLYWGAGRLKTV